MESNASRLILKVLSGRHTGAQLPLVPGEYTIGSSEDCDIILYDQGVADEHCVLLVESDFLKFYPKDGRVTGPEVSLQSGEILIRLYQAVRLGEAVLTVGIEGEEWPEIQLAFKEQSDGEEVEEKSTEDSEVDKECNVESVDALDNGQEFEENESNEELLSRSNASRNRALILVFVFFLFGGALILVCYLYLVKPPENISVIQTLESVISKYGLGGVKLVSGEADGLVLKGFIRDTDSLRILDSRVAVIAPEIPLEIIPMDQVRDNIYNILESYGFKRLKVLVTNDGNVTIKGFAGNKEAYGKVLNLNPAVRRQLY